MSANATTMLPAHAAASVRQAEWSWLYRTAGAAALLCVAFLPIQIAVFVVNPPPASVPGWFQLLHLHPLIGLLDLDLLLMVDQVLTILVFLGLYMALRRAGRSFLLIGVALGLLSAVLFIASNPAFAMLSLSDQYAASGAEAQRAALLAAGQAVMAQWQGSAFHASYITGSIAAILVSLIMLRDGLFRRAAALMGIVSNALALLLYVPVVGVYISVSSVVLLWAWYLLMGIRFFQLARMPSPVSHP